MRWIAYAVSLLPFVATATTFVPFERDIPRVEKCTYGTSRNDESLFYSTHYCGTEDDTLYITGRQIHNRGPNDIIDNIPEGLEYPSRMWEFITADHSRRDTWIWITDDIGSGAISDYMESAVMLLPRVQRTHIEEQGNDLVVTLTTGEEVRFHQKYKKIISGVMSEKPIDLNPDRPNRHFARFTYDGQGVILRSNARGADPRLTKFLSVIKKGLPDCRVYTNVFWTQEGWPKFRFVRDEEAYAAIATNCGTQYLPNL